VIRVALVDDQELVRAGLARILSPADGFEVVAECADGSQAVERLPKLRPDVVVMDIRMPVLDGIAATALLRGRDEPAGVLVLTTFGEDEVLWGAIEAGAAGFVLKDCSAEDLIAAVRAVAGGESDRHALPLEEVPEQGVGRPIELWNRNDVRAEIGDVLQCIVQRRLTCAHAQGFDAPFQCRDATLENFDRRIADPTVAEPVNLEVEQGGAVFGGIKGVRNGLVDRNRDRMGSRVVLVTAVNRDGLASHSISC